MQFGYTDPAGLLYCAYTRDALTSIVPPGESDGVEFDLDNEDFYVLVATGPLNNAGELRHHDEKKASENPIDLGAFGGQ